MEGDESANADLEKWSAVVENHPQLKERNEKAAADWAKANEVPNQEALRLMRTFVPPDIRHCTRPELEARGVPSSIAKRIFDKKVKQRRTHARAYIPSRTPT